MQRPRNRQGQSNRNETHPRRGGRGGRPTTSQITVPNISQVVPNASVSIVLKVDQPTGRQVRGTVADVLTNGNHPRGIKVRLIDGRVGRVQRMISAEEARVGSEGLLGLGRNGEVNEDGIVGSGSGRGREREESGEWGRRRYRDVREDEYLEGPREEGYSLGDLLPAGHPLMSQENSATGNGGGSNLEGFEDVPEEMLHTCPVCGEFEGDEAAVSYHVGKHFD